MTHGPYFIALLSQLVSSKLLLLFGQLGYLGFLECLLGEISFLHDWDLRDSLGALFLRSAFLGMLVGSIVLLFFVVFRIQIVVIDELRLNCGLGFYHLRIRVTVVLGVQAIQLATVAEADDPATLPRLVPRDDGRL